jgi:Reverse transcriptase (RNA-dependent DNA polymerase)
LQRFLGEVDCYCNYKDGTFDWQHPMEFSARANAEDNPTREEAMHGPNKAGYWKAMEKENGTLEDMESWEVVDIESWMNLLPGTWAFRCKRFPDGTIRKLKARFCVRGDRQREGIDFFDTYAPVVNWLTVRLMLVLSEILGLATKQVDYTTAFVHAPIDRDPNWENMTKEEQSRSGIMPRGFGQAGKVQKLKKSLYGLKQAPRNFFLHLKAQLEAIGFKSQEDLDSCLFMSKNVICLVYVDDTLFYSSKMEYINEAIQKLREQGMDLEVKGEVAGFLGVHIERNVTENTIKLTQSGLIKRIIEALEINDLPIKGTPLTAKPLTKDELEPASEMFSYGSVVGMLQYLQNHS